MVVKLKRTIAIMLAFCFLVSITAAAVSAQQVDMAQRIVTGGTTATSTDGKGTVARIFLPAHTFKPGTWVHIVPIGWDYTFTYGDHPILKQSLWLVQPRYDSPDWQRVT
jgi:hypothetical protein